LALWPRQAAYRKNFGKWQVFDETSDVGETTDLSRTNTDFLKQRIMDGSEWAKSHVEPRRHDTDAGLQSWLDNKMPKYETTFQMK
jgi:hypothetical protein